MIQSIFEMLRMYDHLGKSEYIDIAKGKYKLPIGLKEKAKQTKIEKAWNVK